MPANESGVTDLDYMAELEGREARAVSDFRARLEARRAAQAAAASPAEGEAPAQEPAQAEGERPLFDAADVAKSALAGVYDAVSNTANFLLPEGSELPSAEEKFDFTPESTAGGLAKGVTQFATGFIPALRLTRWAGLGATAASTAAGAGSDFFTFDPQEARLSNVLKEFGGVFDNPVTRALSANEDDGEFEGRVKNVLEGAGLGLAVEGTIRTIRWVRGPRQALANAVSNGEVGLAQAADASESASAVTALREQLQDLDNAAAAVRDLDAPRADRILRSDPAALAPEDAQLLEAAQFRAGTSGEPLEEALRALDVERTQLEQIAEANPEMATRLRDLAADGGGVSGARAAVERELGRAEAQYLEALRGLPEDEARRLAAEVDAYAPPAARDSVERVAAEHRARHGDAPPPPRPEPEPMVESKILPGIRVRPEQEARLLAAIRDGADLNEAAQVFDSTNFGRIDTTEDAEKLISSLAAVFGESPNSARLLGVETLEETADKAAAIIQKEAEELDVAPEAVVRAVTNFLPGIQDIAAKVNAVRLVELSLTNHVTGLAKKITTGLASDLDKLNYRRSLTLLANVNDVRAGIASELGRGLGSLRITVSDNAVASLSEIRSILSSDESLERSAAWWAEAGPSMSAAQRRRQLLKEKTLRRRIGDAFTEYWLNSILSGPITHAVNAASNNLVTGWLPIEHMIGGVASGRLQAIPEAMRAYLGMVEGFRAAIALGATFRNARPAFGQLARGELRAAKNTLGKAIQTGTVGKAFMTGELQTVGDFARQFDMPGRGQAISARGLGIDAANYPLAARIVDAFGALINLPTRALTASDELAKAVNYHAQLHMATYDEAAKRGLTGRAAESFRQTVHNNAQLWHSMGVDDERAVAAALGISQRDVRGFLRGLDDAASDYSRYATFTEALASGTLSRKLQEFVNGVPLLRFVVPFVRTPINLMKFGIQRTPGLNLWLGAGAPQMRAMWAAGGKQREAVVGRMIAGTGFWVTAGMLAMNGRITGRGPLNRSERETLMASGWQPYSYVVQGADGKPTYYSFNRSDPFAMFFSIAADLVDVATNQDAAENDNMFMGALVSLSQALLSKSYFTGIEAAVNALSDPESFGPTWLQKYEGSLVPSLFGQVARAVTDEREVRDVTVNPNIESWVGRELDRFRQVLESRSFPGLEDGPPRRNAFGEVVIYPPGWGPDLISPFFSSEGMDDPISLKLKELSDRGEGVRWDMKRRFSNVGGVPLDAEQKDAFIKLYNGQKVQGVQLFGGRSVREELNSVVDAFEPLGRGGLGFGPGGQADRIRGIMERRHRTAARLLMNLVYPDLGRAVRANKIGERLSQSQVGEQITPSILDIINPSR